MAYPPCKCKLKCSWCSRLFRDIAKARREVPALFEVLIALSILSTLLLLDVLWLGRVHTLELEEISELHGKDLNRFRKQFDIQMKAMDSQHKKFGSDLEAAHIEDVSKLKAGHQEELEKQINSIQEQLNSLLALSKLYWDKHAEHGQADFLFNPPKLNGENDEDE